MEGDPGRSSEGRLEAQLRGLERLRVAGFIDEARYQRQRAALLSAADLSQTPPSPTGQSAAPQTAAFTWVPAPRPAPAGSSSSPPPAAPWATPGFTPPPSAYAADQLWPGAPAGTIPPSPWLVGVPSATAPGGSRRAWLLAAALVVVAVAGGGTLVAVAEHHASTTSDSQAAAEVSSTPTPTRPSASPESPALASHLPSPAVLAPLPLGTVVAGGPGSPVRWKAASNAQAVATPIAGGVDLQVRVPFIEDSWVRAPVANWLWATRVDAHVTVISGPRANQVGIGCLTPDAKHLVSFTVTDLRNWHVRIDEAGVLPVIVAAGQSPAIRPTATGNDLSALCTTTEDGRLHLMFAINGVVVSDSTTTAPVMDGWVPVALACSCQGPEEIHATNLTERSVPRDG